MKYLRWAAAGILAAAGVCGIAVAVLYFFGLHPYVILSGSMEPALPAGAVCWIDTRVPYEEIRAGDIIAFELQDTRVIHRAVTVSKEGIETKGDANEDSDGITVRKENLTGRYAGAVPYLGFLLRSKKALLPILVSMAFLMIGVRKDRAPDDKLKGE